MTLIKLDMAVHKCQVNEIINVLYQLKIVRDLKTLIFNNELISCVNRSANKNFV